MVGDGLCDGLVFSLLVGYGKGPGKGLGIG